MARRARFSVRGDARTCSRAPPSAHQSDVVICINQAARLVYTFLLAEFNVGNTHAHTTRTVSFNQARLRRTSGIIIGQRRVIELLAQATSPRLAS